MTNEDIITSARIQLMQDGKIGKTGRQITATIIVNGTKEQRVFDEPEEIHTFQAWKRLGYCVKRGEHAVARIRIWKANVRQEEDREVVDGDRVTMYMKEAAFFSRSQVQKMEAG